MCFVRSKTLVVSKGKNFCLAFSAIEVLSFLTEIMFFFFFFNPFFRFYFFFMHLPFHFYFHFSLCSQSSRSILSSLVLSSRSTMPRNYLRFNFTAEMLPAYIVAMATLCCVGFLIPDF